jgi:hypothetical protein
MLHNDVIEFPGNEFVATKTQCSRKLASVLLYRIVTAITVLHLEARPWLEEHFFAWRPYIWSDENRF